MKAALKLQTSVLNQEWSNGLVVKALDSQSKSPRFKTTGWLQGWLSLSSLRGRLNNYQEIPGIEW